VPPKWRKYGLVSPSHPDKRFALKGISKSAHPDVPYLKIPLAARSGERQAAVDLVCPEYWRSVQLANRAKERLLRNSGDGLIEKTMLRFAGASLVHSRSVCSRTLPAL
jgi:hypothetical protein